MNEPAITLEEALAELEAARLAYEASGQRMLAALETLGTIVLIEQVKH